MDAYESRTKSEPSVTPRQDPILWPGKSHLRALTPVQAEHFEKRGFLFFRQFFTPEEVGVFERELARMQSDPTVRDRPECIQEPSSGEVRSIFNIHRLSPLFAALANDSRLVNAASQILGSDVYIHQSRINLKPGFRGEPFYWHSDFETWHIEDGMPRMRAVSCSILLTPNNKFNGPLMVMPGSHRDYISCVGKTGNDNYKQSLRKQETGVPDDASLTRLVDDYGIVAPTGPAGSVLLFDCNLMHGSSSNLTPWPRSNVFFVFNSMENQLGPPASRELKPRPEFVATREVTRLQARACDYKKLAAAGNAKGSL
jgi:ectoine hydroxylase